MTQDVANHARKLPKCKKNRNQALAVRKQKIEYGSDENVKLLQNVGRSKYILSLFCQNFLRL